MHLGVGQLPEHMETIFQAFPLAELPPPPPDAVFRCTVAGPRATRPKLFSEECTITPSLGLRSSRLSPETMSRRVTSATLAESAMPTTPPDCRFSHRKSRQGKSIFDVD